MKLFSGLFAVGAALLLHSSVVFAEQGQSLTYIERKLDENLESRRPKDDFLENMLSQAATDFFQSERETVTVIHPEKENARLLQEAVYSQESVSETPQENVSSPFPLVDKEVIAAIPPLFLEDIPVKNGISQELPQETLDKIYEEPLPEDVFDEYADNTPEQVAEEDEDNEFTHIYDKNIKNLTIIPSKKPLYFGDKPVIVIVIDDMGISHKRTADIASLHFPLTVSFLTYAKNMGEQIENSRKAGQEIMIHVPMEAQKKVDEAPDVLTTKMTTEEIKQNLSLMLNKFDNIRGINNHMGSKLTEDKERMVAVMEVLRKRELFFLDSKTSPLSVAETVAVEIGVACAHRHVFLDNNNDKDYILAQLERTERLARKNGYAIAIGHPKSQTYAALKEWLPMLDEKKIALKPLSEIVDILNPNK